MSQEHSSKRQFFNVYAIQLLVWEENADCERGSV